MGRKISSTDSFYFFVMVRTCDKRLELDPRCISLGMHGEENLPDCCIIAKRGMRPRSGLQQADSKTMRQLLASYINVRIVTSFDHKRNGSHVAVTRRCNSEALPPSLTFWCRNYIFNFSTPVYKMWIIEEPNTLELWNKLHFEEKNVNNRGTKYFRIMTQTAFWRGKMWIIQEPNTLELWNKLHFEKEKC